jgi:hypothetical protein
MDTRVLKVMALSTLGGGAGYLAGFLLAALVARGDDSPSPALVLLPSITGIVGAYYGTKLGIG